MDQTPVLHPQTVLFLFVFFVGYVVYLLRKAAKNQVDVFDFVWLSAVGVVPILFISFPFAVIRLSELVGVKFPFVILFGILHFVTFIILISLVIRLKKQQSKLVEAVQNLSLSSQISKKSSENTKD